MILLVGISDEVADHRVVTRFRFMPLPAPIRLLMFGFSGCSSRQIHDSAAGWRHHECQKCWKAPRKRGALNKLARIMKPAAESGAASEGNRGRLRMGAADLNLRRTRSSSSPDAVFPLASRVDLGILCAALSLGMGASDQFIAYCRASQGSQPCRPQLCDRWCGRHYPPPCR